MSKQLISPSLTQKNFKVIIRVRPLTVKQREEIDYYEQSQSKKMRQSLGSRNNIKLSPSAYSFYAKYYNFPVNQVLTISQQQNTVYLADPEYKNVDRKMKPYSYSNVYSWDDNNQHIFNENLQTDVKKVIQGYNCTILAYGITGSGKTFTIFGKDPLLPNSANTLPSPKKATMTANKNIGISSLAFDYLLQQKNRLIKKQRDNIKKFQLKFSFIEIYNENVRDLLTADNTKCLNIVQDGRGNTTVSDVTQITINNINEIQFYINMGTSKRAFASTNANQHSSRSHAILQLQVEIERVNNQRTIAKLFIIDLAGSQKIQSLNSSKKMQEGANINKSLLALGNCITTLSQNSRKNVISHIPYRDSKLTRMLKDSLGGNTKTIMIACISSNPFLIQQTTTTLNYALRAQGITKKLMKNCMFEGQDQLNEQFICMKCKKVSSMENSQEKQQKQMLFPPSSINNENINDTNGVINNDLAEQIYQDILDNARETEKIKNIQIYGDLPKEQLSKLQQTNKKQKLQLKRILMTLLLYKNPGKPKRNDNNNEQENGDQNKQNFGFESRGELESSAEKILGPKPHNLSGSKSRRRRSHNKFEIPKRIETAIIQ